jgi:hypothetical protein
LIANRYESNREPKERSMPNIHRSLTVTAPFGIFRATARIGERPFALPRGRTRREAEGALSLATLLYTGLARRVAAKLDDLT